MQNICIVYGLCVYFILLGLRRILCFCFLFCWTLTSVYLRWCECVVCNGCTLLPFYVSVCLVRGVRSVWNLIRLITNSHHSSFSASSCVYWTNFTFHPHLNLPTQPHRRASHIEARSYDSFVDYVWSLYMNTYICTKWLRVQYTSKKPEYILLKLSTYTCVGVI